MGLLDDAIREHLDLKRRRGADPSEIAREESEALGPVRREAPDDAHEGGSVSLSSYADHEPAALDEPAAAYDDDSEPAPYDAADDLVAGEPPATHDAPYAEREDESATPPHGDPLAHQQTREFSATELGDALGHEGDDDATPESESESDDELEDTPDFLQET